MKIVVTFLSLLTSGLAFNSPAPPKDNTFLKSKIGATAPFPEGFDPLNLSGEKLSRFNYFREAEIKHGRLGMFASVAFPLIETNTHKPAIDQFQQLDPMVQTSVIAAMLALEFYGMERGWEPPSTKLFTLKEDYKQGDLGFNVVKDWSTDLAVDLQNKELNNGRLAMLSAAGMIAQELVHPVAIFS
tara:strand:- start:808 stop:1365 length:558 start_codon:yes stop_codon:yes gene_type:complete